MARVLSAAARQAEFNLPGSGTEHEKDQKGILQVGHRLPVGTLTAGQFQTPGVSNTWTQSWRFASIYQLHIIPSTSKKTNSEL